MTVTLGDITPGPGAKYTNTTNVTTPSAPDPAALLNELVALREAATAGPWRVSNHENREIAAGDEWVADTVRGNDAALIVAAVNALPGLVGAVQAVLGLAGELSQHGTLYSRTGADNARRIRAAVTAALAGEPQP